MNDDESRSIDDRPTNDPVVVLLRLLVGGTAEGADAVLRRLFPPDSAAAPERSPGDEPEAHRAALARQALIGLLFAAHGASRRSASAVGRLVARTGRFWGSVLAPVLHGRALRPLRMPADYLLERSSRELERWARVGRSEEQRSREIVRRIAMTPADEIVAYLRASPELERLVRAQARSLLDELADDPHLAAVIRAQGDRYVDHLHDHPEAVQELVRGQSVGLAEEVANSVRRRAVSADTLLERVVRTLLGRRPRRDLPESPPEVRERALSHGTHSDEHE